MEAGAVVGEDAFGPDAKGAEVGNSVSQELCRARLGFVGIDVCEADAGMIVDRDEGVLLACLDGIVRGARNALAHALDAPELLGVDVDQIAGMLVLVTHDRLAGLQVAQPR